MSVCSCLPPPAWGPPGRPCRARLISCGASRPPHRLGPHASGLDEPAHKGDACQLLAAEEVVVLPVLLPQPEERLLRGGEGVRQGADAGGRGGHGAGSFLGSVAGGHPVCGLRWVVWCSVSSCSRRRKA